MARRTTGLLSKVMLAAAAVVLALVLTELALRVAAAVVPSVDALLGTGSSPTVPDPVLGHRPSPLMSDSDPSGFRNARRPRSVEVVAIGDSQTFGIGVAREDSWPHVLEREHNIPTYSLAYGGYGPTHELVLAREALRDLSPRVLVIAVYAGNDLYDSWEMVHGLGQLPELLPSDPDQRAELERATAGLPPPQTDWNRLREATAAPEPPATTVRAVAARHLRLFGLARAVKRTLARTLASSAGAERPAADPEVVRATLATADPAMLLPARAGGVATVLTPAARLAAMDLADPRIREGLRLSLESIRLIHQEAAASGARVLLLMIATKELVFAPWADPAPSAEPEMARLVDAETGIWHDLAASCDQLGVEWTATVSPLREAIAAGRNPYFEDWDGHPNPLGHRIIAATVASSATLRDRAALR